MARTGIVTDAAIDVLAAALSLELRLEQPELRRIAERQAEALRREGFSVTVPVEAFAAALRRTRST